MPLLSHMRRYPLFLRLLRPFFRLRPPSSVSLRCAALRCGLGAALLLAGCANLGPTPDATTRTVPDVSGGFILDGRFSLTQRAAMQAEQRHSGRLHWKYAPGTPAMPGASAAPASSEILLSSPLGQGIAEIIQDARGARLTTAEGKTFAAPDAETLTREALGYALPLAQLADWVRARSPMSSAPGPERRTATNWGG